MRSINHSMTVAKWQTLINSIGGERCDLDVLLRDEWRHRVVIRDNYISRDHANCEFSITGDSYSRLKALVSTHARASFESIVLAAFHSFLSAFGHGRKTVVAYIEAVGKHVIESGKLWPSIVDHVEFSESTCLEAIEMLSKTLAQDSIYVEPMDLLQRGLFDALLVWTDDSKIVEQLSQFPLAVTVFENESVQALTWRISYATELFESRVIAGAMDVAHALLNEYATNPMKQVGELELISEMQKRQLEAWNATDGDFPVNKRLENLFEEEVLRSSHHEALVFEKTSWTYQRLNERCNEFAHWLLSPDVELAPEEIVAIYLDKSDLPIVAALGIWKAGGAFVPIDTSYPDERIRLTVQDTNVFRIVTNQHYVEKLQSVVAPLGREVQIIALETALETASFLSKDNPALQLGSNRKAYVMYTSGTTGVPKGVAKEHCSVVNSITDLSVRYGMSGQPGEERIALFASLVFEPFLRQTLLALINGHAIVVVPNDVRLDPYRFPLFISENGITYLNGTRSVLQHFDLRKCPTLRKIALVGEELTSAGLRDLRETFEGHIINEYAFTESAFVTAIKEFPKGIVDRSDRSIGRPVRNVKWYILSNNMKLVPIGAIGELYIGGRGVADGYLNREDLSRERFLPNPFQTDDEKSRGQNRLIYKTGDLARMLPTGEVEYMGRSDFQLKINGVRIEPGEIEARATEFPGVRKCVVIARDGAGDRHLVGYYVADSSIDVSEEDLISFLEERLIRVMVPARMIRLDKIPININGKVDRRALPEVTVSATRGLPNATGQEFPEYVIILRKIWSEVLGLPADGIHPSDDFFRLGGQSISGVLFCARVRSRLRRHITVEELFSLRTLEKLANLLGQKHALVENDEAVSIDATPDGQTVVLSPNGLQLSLLYHDLKFPGDDAYVMQSVYLYHCSIEVEMMKKAWEYAQKKYPSLRSRFEWSEQPQHFIDANTPPLDWRFHDLSGIANDAEQKLQIEALQRRDRTEPYSLQAGRLFRVYLVKQRDDLFVLLFSCHHIILDGWSLPVLHDYVHSCYLSIMAGDSIKSLTDNAYISAQRYWEVHRNDHIDYWMQNVAQIGDRGDYNGLLNDSSRYKVSLSSYDRVRIHRTRTLGLGANLTSSLKAICRLHQLTLHSMLQFVWHRTLHAVGGGATTVVGTVVSGRNLPINDIENSVGLFINTLPIIVQHTSESVSVLEAVSSIQADVNAMQSRSTVELGRLASGDMKRALFDILLVLENYPLLMDNAMASQHQEQLRFERLYDIDKVDHPLAVVAREEGQELVINLWYAGELFDESAVDELLETVHTLFAQMAEDVLQPVSQLELVSARTIGIFDRWNDTRSEFPQEKTLHRIFEDVAERWPAELALVFGPTRYTYRELNERANSLAHYLTSMTSLGANDLVALMLNKNDQMIVTILGVWKAGAAYVPIDPSYPDDRIRFMMEDTRAKLLLTNAEHGARLRRLLTGKDSQPVLEVEEIPLKGFAALNPVTSTSSTDLAYAIYTSGTTGNPKAVLIEHRGVVNLQTSLTTLFSLNRSTGKEVFLSFSNYVFDHFVEQMTDALLNGQTLVVLDDTMRTDTDRLYKYLSKHAVTYLSGTPSVLSLYDFSSVTSLTRIDAIGEDFTEPIFNRIRSSFKGTIINGYGPTEISITSHKRPYGTDEPRRNKSIGRALSNTTCYVLDSKLKRLPIGAIGELYIGGVGVARGYLNRDELTAERFIANPFQTVEERQLGINAKIYRTGDLVRWLHNGELEYLGRNDSQVKINGQRVELGEVESALSSHPDVLRSLVIARDHTKSESQTSQKYLVAFYLSHREIAEHDLRDWMRSRISEAILPARFLRLDEVPVTQSGKLDVRRLPATDLQTTLRNDFKSPSDETEFQLCGIWSKILGLAPHQVGADDDFFALGGDSLRAIELALKITREFGRSVNVAAVFEKRTIALQAQFIRSAPRQQNEAIATGLSLGSKSTPPASLAQERLLFINDFMNGTAAYNIHFVVEIPAYDPSLGEVIRQGVKALVRRHAALRTQLHGGIGDIRTQHVLPPEQGESALRCEEFSISDSSELDELLVGESAYVFSLTEGLPIRTALFYRADATDRLYLSVVVHHSCFDGWSWRIFLRELKALAEGIEAPSLSSTLTSYADFAIWQRARLRGERLEVLCRFWKQQLEGFEPLNLPCDYPRPQEFDYRGREVFFQIEAACAEGVNAIAREARVSANSVLLAAYCLMLKTFTGQSDIVVGIPSANRSHPEFDNVIGYFANLLVLRNRVEDTSTLLEFVRAVGESVVQAQIHQELPFGELVSHLRIDRDASRHPIVQAIFNSLDEEHSRDFGSKTADKQSWKRYTPSIEGRTIAKFDLALTVTRNLIGYEGNITYAESLFDGWTVSHMIRSYKEILRKFATHCSESEAIKISELQCLDDDARIEIMNTNESSSISSQEIDSPQTLQEVFRRVAADRPDEVAVSGIFGEMTYRELDNQATRLAHELASIASLRPNDLVAIAMDKSERMIVAILAVWKSGAAYVPIDPIYPDERIAFMLQDTCARLVIADQQYVSRLELLSDVVVLDVAQSHLVHEVSSFNCGVSGVDLAYAIYTSGTTGQPKAVMISHENVISFRNSVLGAHLLRESNGRHAIMFLSNFVFDFSVEQFVLSFLAGNKLIIPPVSQLVDDAFYDEANRHGLTYLSGTPTQLLRFDLSRFNHLRTVLVAGEPFLPHHFSKIRREFSGQLLNAYGTTETTVYNLIRPFPTDKGYCNDLGKPLPNTQVYVMGTDGQLLPPGAVGELCISGTCVGNGYLNRPQLTQQRFISNPLSTGRDKRNENSSILYKTGDMVRRRSDGALEFLGRNDSQVKINGIRVELKEVEALMVAFPGIHQCAVIARRDTDSSGAQKLVGYYVIGGNIEVDESKLLSFLRSKLVPAMVPSAFVRIDGGLPISINGKLDIRSLPDPTISSVAMEFATPRSRIESRLCWAWRKLLPIEHVGIDHDFFRCGGDSIAALQLAGILTRELKRKISVKHIFDYPTVRGFVDNVLPTLSETNNSEERKPLEGDCPLTPIQKWFFAKQLQKRNHWNHNFAIQVPPLDLNRLKEAIDRLLEHHDVFRLRFCRIVHNGNESVSQVYYDYSKPFLHSLDVKGLSEDMIQAELLRFQSNFELQEGSLCSVAYLHGFEDGSARIWMAVHHLIIDTVSWRIIAQDLEILYHGGDLETQTCSYRDWSQALQRYKPSSDELQLWSSLSSSVIEFNNNCSSLTASSSSRIRFTLNEQATTAMLVDPNRSHGTSVTDLLLTAVGYALQTITNQSVNYITVENHGREVFEGAPEARDTVGWFTTMHPFKLEVQEEAGRSIELTKAMRLRIPYNGIGYGITSGTYGGLKAPLPWVTFNYLGRLGREKVTSGKQQSIDTLSMWRLDPAFCGVSRAPDDEGCSDSLLDLTLSCVEGRMIIDVESRLSPLVTQRFVTELESKLMAISNVVTNSMQKLETPALSRKAPDPFDPYILLNEEACGPPLLILPPGEGGAESYLNNLAKHLPEIPLILFNNLHLHSPMASYEALAHYYVEQIQQLNISGPYHFFGWSFGGVLAFEIALQLSRSSAQTANLMMFDSFFNVQKAAKDTGLTDPSSVIDAINTQYHPTQDDLKMLLAFTENILLIKTPRLDPNIKDEPRKRFFSYFANSQCNNLETLIPLDSFTVEIFPHDTHFSWVQKEDTVTEVARTIRKRVRKD